MFLQTNNALCEDINRIRLTLLHFGYATVGKEWTGTCANPLYSRLYYITEGEAEVRSSDGARTSLARGHWVLLPSEFSFDYACHESMGHLYFHVKMCDLDDRDMLSSFSAPILLAREEEIGFYLHCLQKGGLSNGLLLRHKLQEILLTMQKEHEITFEINRFSPCVVRAIKYIRRHLSARLTLEEIAAHAFVSKSTLTKHFRRELSKSVLEYVSDLILSEASMCLLKTDLSVLSVSEKYGFSDQFYFSRRFKERFGIPPQRYRKTALI